MISVPGLMRDLGRLAKRRAPQSVFVVSEHHDPLQGPISPERSNRIGRQHLDWSRPLDLKRPQRMFERHDECDEEGLSDLNSKVEKQESERNFRVRQSQTGQTACEDRNPCSSPNANATTQGCRMVKLVSPRHRRTISGPRKKMLSAMAAFSSGAGALA